MKNEMRPVPFEELFTQSIEEYEAVKSLFGVPVVDNPFDIPVGPAAGPHTQLAQNIVSAYAAGASVFELKTVQILEGEELGITKPCIYVGSEVYNTEWSTELTVVQAAKEYIKAALLIQALAKKYGLRAFDRVQFVMSVGYDLEGIKSEKVDSFIEAMKDSSKSEEWKYDIDFLERTGFDTSDFTSEICDTVTLSTMHGCPAKDIELIGRYLLKEKGLNTYIKMNPTLLGKDMIEEILVKKGYDLSVPSDVFETDINPAEAFAIIRACLATAKEKALFFGIKLTNTLPVLTKNGELAGERMYMSGAALYALSINTAKLLSDEFDGCLSLSYSGGVDDKNVAAVLGTGIAPITVSSYLLQAGGYKNINKLLVKVDRPEVVDLQALTNLANTAITDENYHRKEKRIYKKQESYTNTCSICHNCEDVCPNRANRRFTVDGKNVVLHNRGLCNECGACACLCVMGHVPYMEKTDRIEG